MNLKTACNIKNYQLYNDPELITLWQKGDERAFDSLYNRYVIYLTNVAIKKTESVDIAKECVQEVFISLYHRKNELHTTVSLSAYLYTALQNKIYNQYQKQLVRWRHERAAGNSLELTEDDLHETYESKELAHQIKEKINALPPQCRKVFLMSREEQLPYKDIAEQLNISINTVDQHIQKALRILRASTGVILLVFLLIGINRHCYSFLFISNCVWIL